MDIVKIGQQLSQMEFALVHGGPKHPIYPNLGFQHQIDQVFDKYPRLKKDQTYVDFLETYVGALILYPDSSIHVAIHGVWDYTLHLLEDELLEDSRFLCFSSVMFHPSIEGNLNSLSFAFDLSHDNIGILKDTYFTDETAELGFRREPYQPYCDTFAEWLDRLVKAKGRLVD